MNTLRAVLAAIRQGILMLFACLVVFAVGEIAVRTYAAFFMEGTSFFRDDRFISPWFTGTDYPSPKILEDGSGLFRHRSAPTSTEKPTNVQRIITIGGSTTVNARAFAVNGKDYASSLEALLNGGGGEQKFEVLNAGGDGFSSAHSLINLHFRLLEFSPDAVIVMHNINDISVNYVGRRAMSDYSNKYMTEFFINPQLQAGLSVKGFLNQSRLIAATGLTAMPHSYLDRERPIDEGLRYFERNLRTMAQICKSNGTTLILLSQPNRLSKERGAKAAKDFLFYNQRIKAISEETGAVFVDMFTEMGHDPDLFVDAVHYSPRGIEKFSRVLHEHLKDAL